MTRIKLLYLMYPSEAPLKEGEAQEFQELFIDWDLPFLPRPGDGFELEAFIGESSEDRPTGISSRMWRVAAVSWDKGDDGTVHPSLLLDGWLGEE